MRSVFRLLIITAACLLTVTTTEQGHAQSPAQRPDLFKKVQDSIWVFLPLNSSDTLNPNLVSGCYRFTMQYDSTCITEYLFTEPSHNASNLMLRNWQLGRSVNLNEDHLSLNSRTEDFIVHAGDTISFMREFRWFDARTQRQHLSNFFSRDTLTYVVELANAHDSTRYQTRAAVIDSFGVLPRATPGAPRFIGSGDRTIMGVRKFTVPTSLNGKRLFMRIRVRARGTGDYHFTRTDDYTVGTSLLLTKPDIITSVNYMKQDQFWKAVADHEGGEMSAIASQIMIVERQGLGNPSFTLRLASAPSLGEITIALHDANGGTKGIIFSGTLNDPQVISHSLPSISGTYFISIIHGNRTLHTEKIIFTK